MLPLPLYHSESSNCSGQTTDSCNGDIVQSPVNFTTLSDRYSAFAVDFIGNVSHDTRPFFLCKCGPRARDLDLAEAAAALDASQFRAAIASVVLLLRQAMLTHEQQWATLDLPSSSGEQQLRLLV